MKDTAIQEINEKFKNLNSHEFYGWYWNNPNILEFYTVQTLI